MAKNQRGMHCDVCRNSQDVVPYILNFSWWFHGTMHLTGYSLTVLQVAQNFQDDNGMDCLLDAQWMAH